MDTRSVIKRRPTPFPTGSVMACYPKELASPPVSDVPVPLDRKAGIEAYKIAKSAEEYKAQMRGR